MNPTNWQEASGGFSATGYYDPNHPGGAGWVVGWNPTTYITYAPITLEVWIEMNMMLTYQYTSYQWHRLGDAAETIDFTIAGTISSNDRQIVLMSPSPGFTLSNLNFVENVFGVPGIGAPGNENARNIPITWETRWGSGLVIGEQIVQNWGSPYWLCGNMLVSNSGIPACDHWFQFKGTFSLLLHEADGYYKLAIAGCPYPEM